MPTYVVLLRAVNVGGTGKLPMADFRKLLENLDFRNVATYIQSGNAVFDAPGTPAEVTQSITAGLEKLLKAPVGVLLRTHEQLARMIAGNPFAAEAAANGALVHAAFLAAPAGKAALTALAEISAKYPARRDRYHLVGDTLYLHFPDGSGETKFSGRTLDKALGVTATARNWNTVLKLHQMSARK